MGFLDSLFRRKGTAATAPAEDKPVEEVCPHAALVPRWDRPEDMGNSELVSTYVCEACGGSFGRQEGERLMSEAAETLRISEEERP